jgi:hypothetical protein
MEFMHQASLVNALDQAGTFVPMHLDCCADHSRRESICFLEVLVHCFVFFATFV